MNATKLPLLLLFVLLTRLMACQMGSSSEGSVAEQLIAKSIKFHDPQGKWSEFSASIQQTSYLERLDPLTGEKMIRERKIDLDIPRSRFVMAQELEGHLLMRTVSGKAICTTEWNKDSISQAERDQYRLDCAGAERMRDYFRYLIGLPMVLRDKQAIVQDTITEIEFEGNVFQVVTIDYPPSGEHPTWQFYIDPESGALHQAKFFRTNTEDGTLSGEIIRLEDPTEFGGMVKFGRFVWTYLDGKPLAEEIYTFTPIDERQ